MDVNYIDGLAAKIRREVPPSKLPAMDTVGLFRIYAVLALCKGQRVTAEDVHNAWSAWMSATDPRHPALKPYADLDDAVAADDEPYAEAIRKVARNLAQNGPVRAIDGALFPNGIPSTKEDIDRTVDLYKLMVGSSENLVSRRQGVNTFFLTINGAILTAAGLVVSNQPNARIEAIGLAILLVTGAILALAWRSLIRSFGQLNAGKFAVINRIEEVLPAAVYLAEWKALEEGRNPKKYRTFTSREVWTPWTFFAIYVGSAALAVVVALGLITM